MPLKSVNNERELLVNVTAGNVSAFNELFYAYHSQLGEYIFLITGSMELAEEILQDIFVKIWQNRKELTQVKSFPDYLFILTRNYTLSTVRKEVNQKKHREAFELSVVNGREEYDNDPIPVDYEAVLEKAVSQLPSQQQKVFLLKKAGKKNDEIASALNIHADSVKKYQQWAIRSIKNFIKNDTNITVIVVVFSVLKK